jgi:hypothetical protein
MDEDLRAPGVTLPGTMGFPLGLARRPQAKPSLAFVTLF